MFYPRKQTVIILLVSVMAVGATAYYAKMGSSGSNPAASSAEAAPVVQAAHLATIPDNGTWKKEFIDASSSVSFKAARTSKSSAAADQLTATDVLGRQFLTKYAELKKAGLTADRQTVSDVANQLVQSSISNIQTPQPYTLKSLHIVQTSDASSLGPYSASLSGILNSYIPDQDHNEAVVAEQALDQNDMSVLQQIDPLIMRYKTAIQALLTMRVPQALAQYHLDLVNGIGMALFNAEALRHTDTDPIKGMAAVGLEVTALETMSNAMTSIKQFLNSAGVPMS